MKYVNQVTKLMRFIVEGIYKNDTSSCSLAIDMTMGNGHDSDFLSSIFKEVISIDIQDIAVKNYNNPSNVKKFQMDHKEIDKLKVEPNLVVYNLGYLPGGNESITTNYESTIESIEKVLKVLKKNGLIIIAIYTGHDLGKERDEILNFLSKLDDKLYSVIRHNYLNRGNYPPELVVIEKR